MPNEELKDCFTFIWTIENFSHCLAKVGENIQSPIFVLHSEDKFEWSMYLYPKGDEQGKNYLGLFLSSVRKFHGQRTFQVDFDLSFLSSDGSPLVTYKTENKVVNAPWMCGYTEILERNVVFDSKRGEYLPQDTLTVRCRIWTTDEDYKGNHVCFARTVIGVENKSFAWGVEGFSSLQPLQRKFKCVKPTSEKVPQLSFELLLDEERLEIEIIESGTRRRVFLTCKISVLEMTGKVIESAQGEYLFESSARKQAWRFPPFISKTELIKNKDTHLPNDVLLLRCECTISGVVLSNQLEYSTALGSSSVIGDTGIDNQASGDSGSSSEHPSAITCDLQCIYEERILCDVNLKTATKTFPVHKAILGARSSVFKAMFSSDMKEMACDSIDIPDVDADTMDRMLLFIYTDAVQQMQWENASKLYCAANKYLIQPLRERCASALKSSLCVLNACQILVLADMCQDQELKSTTLDFMSSHKNKIIGTDEWKTFEKRDVNLALETLRELCQKNVN